MRIVAGHFGGRKLHVPKGRDIRPTSDKVRGAVFNALQSRGAVEAARVLDGFCGSGALGLEALSRGAAHCTFIDKSRVSVDAARMNAESFGVKDETHFLVQDVTKLKNIPESSAPFTLVFLDPPYHRDLLPAALSALHEGHWIADDTLCVCETEKNFQGVLPQFFIAHDERLYGDTKILMLRYASTPE